MDDLIHRELTRSQDLIGTGQKLNQHDPLYNMVFNFSIHGALNVDAFKTAFQQIVSESDALRIYFKETDSGETVQVFRDKLDYDIEVVELVGKAGEARKYIEERSQKIFDHADILFDSALLKIEEDEFIWYFNIHHLITDAWSFSILFRGMSDIYKSILKGNGESNVRFPSYADFVGREKKLREYNTKVQDYWSSIVEDLSGIRLQPYGLKNPSPSTTSKRLKVDLDDSTIKDIIHLSRTESFRTWSEELSIYSLFLTATFIYLNKITGEENVVIGTPSHNRTTPADKLVPGLFIELFPLSITIDEKDTFKTVFSKLQLEINSFLRNVQPGGSTSEINNLFNVVLNFITARFGDFAGIPTDIEWFHQGHIDPSHHMRIHVMSFKDAEDMSVHLDLNTSLFPSSIANNATKHFANVLVSLARNPDEEVSNVQLIDNDELEEITKLNHEVTREEKPFISVLDRFLNVCQSNPDKELVIAGDRNWTYGEINAIANNISHQIASEKTNNTIVIFLKRSHWFVASILAAMKSGKSYVPIPSEIPAKRIEYILKDVNASTVISDEDLGGRIGSGYNKLIVGDGLLDQHPPEVKSDGIGKSDTAYIMYTSGSTGKPKGVLISHGALANYLTAAEEIYSITENRRFPLYSSVGFDLTVTSLFLPLITGGQLHVYDEEGPSGELSIIDVIKDNKIDFIKMTPSHAKLLENMDLSDSSIRTVIFGGEDLKSDVVSHLKGRLSPHTVYYNEYGPTESTVGCICSKVDGESNKISVPIGKPFAGTRAFILDKAGNTVPKGVIGELYIGGPSLSHGYNNNSEETSKSFVKIPDLHDEVLYNTGDLVRLNENGDLEYLGRKDRQMKFNGIRFEAGEIENTIKEFTGVQDAVVDMIDSQLDKFHDPEQFCERCGLPSNYPSIQYDSEGICNYCNSYDSFQVNAKDYFKEMDELKVLRDKAKQRRTGDYDCLMLFSGGKDSSYALAMLVELGFDVMSFTLDNGYISEDAKANINTIVGRLGVDHVFGTTQEMNAIFRDSLNRYNNVCDGCFKTLYTLSTELALEKGIPIVFTGLSRGQFFETRLTEELFRGEGMSTKDIDQVVLEARKSYHRVDDEVKKRLNTSFFDDDEVFEKVEFHDFYRYCDVSLSELYEFLNTKLSWKRPKDTGRSTNCIINDLGIFMHKRKRGYHNYAFPYSWDVRMGHKTKEEAINELNDHIDENEVERMKAEIGYVDFQEEHQLVAYLKTDRGFSESELRRHIESRLPRSIVPSQLVFVDNIPLTKSGKVDLDSLRQNVQIISSGKTTYAPPTNDIEEIVIKVWEDIFKLNKLGLNDDFYELGGHSLMAVQIISRLNEELRLELPIRAIFEHHSIGSLSKIIEDTILQLLEQ